MRLFGHNPERYADLQVPLAKMKIEDAKKLKRELGSKLDLLDKSQEQADLYIHFVEVDNAIKHWTKILEEEC